jgi:hypothetical protein
VGGLTRRFSRHKKQNNKCSSKEIIKQGDSKMFLIEDYLCDDIKDLRRREGEWIKVMMGSGLCTNRFVAGRTRQEYDASRNTDEERIRQKNKAVRRHYNKNKELFKEFKEKCNARFPAS